MGAQVGGAGWRGVGWTDCLGAPRRAMCTLPGSPPPTSRFLLQSGGPLERQSKASALLVLCGSPDSHGPPVARSACPPSPATSPSKVGMAPARPPQPNLHDGQQAGGAPNPPAAGPDQAQTRQGVGGSQGVVSRYTPRAHPGTDLGANDATPAHPPAYPPLAHVLARWLFALGVATANRLGNLLQYV